MITIQCYILFKHGRWVLLYTALYAIYWLDASWCMNISLAPLHMFNKITTFFFSEYTINLFHTLMHSYCYVHYFGLWLLTVGYSMAELWWCGALIHMNYSAQCDLLRIIFLKTKSSWIFCVANRGIHVWLLYQCLTILK